MAIIQEVNTAELDEKVGRYTDPDNVATFQQKAEDHYRVMPIETWKEMRRLCKTDLFFLTYAVLGYNLLAENLHGHLASWMMRNKGCRFKEILLPRGHYKSTICTIADGIRICLPDDIGDTPWPESLGVNCRLLIAHETSDQASKFLVSIIGHFTSNPLLMGLFPECVPNIRTHRINRQELELPRTQIWSEATYSTMGVGAKSQGKHFNYIKLDDLIGDKARDSKSEMETAIEWFDNIQAFFSKFSQDKFDLIGTRYAMRDLYDHVHKTYGKAILKYIRPVEEYNPVTKVMEPIFPEGGFNAESIAILRKNPKTWVQYSNDPTNLDNKFDQKWLRFYEIGKDKFIKIRKDNDEIIRIHPQQMDITFLLDPAMKNGAGFLITGTYKIGKHEDIVILEAIKENFLPSQLCDLIFKKVHQYRPRTLVIEEVLFSGLFEPWFKAEMKLRGKYFHVTLLTTQQKEKSARILGLTSWFAAAKIYMHPTQLDLIQEYKEFNPEMPELFHLLDSLAQGPRSWVFPYTSEEWAQMQEQEAEVLSGRDVETGY